MSTVANVANVASVASVAKVNNKKVLQVKKREIVANDSAELIERIDRFRNTQGYPILNDFLLRKMFLYFEIKDLLKFSTLCWKFRLLITEDLNRSWHYYYLIYTKQAPIQSVTHCHATYGRANVFSNRYEIKSTGLLFPLRVECMTPELRTKHGFLTTYTYPNYQAYYQQMATPLDQTPVKEEELLCLVEGEWNTREQFKISQECRYRHALQENYYPLGSRIYATKYDKNINYYWKLQEVILEELNKYISRNNLKTKSTKLQHKINNLQKDKDDVDRILNLQKIKLEENSRRAGPTHKLKRFHMFREVYFAKNKKYLSVGEASRLWATMSESEKEKYANIADIQYEDGVKHKEVAKIRY
jgi:hypothetical protein